MSHPFVSTQEAEDIAFAQGVASEATNCLSEASAEAARLSSSVPVTGEGQVLLTVSAPYYCRATDAFAGMQVVARQRFSTRLEALEHVANERYDGDERDFTITPPLARNRPIRVRDQGPF